MGIKTTIEWCDSTVNPQEGCEGCELWRPGDGGTCYAAGMINRFGSGSAGHPDRFDRPEIYPYRLVEACGWPDLTGTDRPDKPWLDGYPRCVFVDDMGDTFTERLDDPDYLGERVQVAIDEGRPRPDLYVQSLRAVLDGGHWLEPMVPMMAEAPHVWMMLTKRPGRMARFFERLGHVPANFLLMTSVTSSANISRLRRLLSIPGAAAYGVSYEPVRGHADIEGAVVASEVAALHWAILGGESGPGSAVCETKTMLETIEGLSYQGAAIFVKQLGRRARIKPRHARHAIEAGCKYDPDDGVVTFLGKGNNPAEWPEELRRREMPKELLRRTEA